MDTTGTPARRVVEALLDARLLDPALRDPALDVAARALTGPASGPPSQAARGGVPQVVEVVAYLGGALVLAAGSLLMFDVWSELGFGGQATLLAAAGLALVLAGGVAALTESGVARRAPEQDSRRRLAGALLTAAAFCAGGLAALVLDRGLGLGYDGPGGVDPLALATWSAVLVVTVLGYRLAPTALGLVVGFGASAVVVTALLAGSDGLPGAVWMTSAALVLLGLVQLTLAERRVVHETTIARVLAALLVLVGSQWPLLEDGTRSVAYASTSLVAVAGALAYLRTGAWPYLAVAVLAVTIVVPEVVSDWTGGGLGAIGAVLLTGITLLVASGVATLARSRRVRAV